MSSNHFIHAMLSHRGRVRQANEDTCAAEPEVGAYVVCDGMGGAAAGEIASRVAADTFLGHLVSERQERVERAAGNKGALLQASKPQARLQAAIQAANQAVYRQSIEKPGLSGMGTTMVALLHDPITSVSNVQGATARRSKANHLNSRVSDPPTLWLAHVGDSRCYRQRKGQLEQLTQDHSLVEEQVRAGQITAAEAARSPMRNLITRAIGAQATVEIETQSHRPQENDLYLLASDGLTHELRDEEIANILEHIPVPRARPRLMSACEALITAANRNGGHDNITVLLVGVTSQLRTR
ncbi:MAG: protein phosphatase 2C domain-containing protein [Acidobacteriota bacterium]|nr:protein phosphatase 2C domain-containing protein [Acidobacteriota bacterium]